MNFLEVDFLFGLGFHLNVTPATFQTYCAYLQKEMLLHLQPLPVPPMNFEDSSLLMGKSPNHQYICFNEDDSSSQQQQQQQLVV